MAVQTKLEYLTNRDLFSNYYLENLLCEYMDLENLFVKTKS